MRDLLDPGAGPAEPDPVRRAQAAMARHPLPRRFYAEVQVREGDGGHAILLDGRPARTPGRKPLALTTATAAELLAQEWRAQTDVIDPARMHATRIANTGIDSVGARLSEVQADVAAYAASDLVCYRAGEPEGLVARQNAAWNPVIDWAADSLGVRLILAEGVVHQSQDERGLAAIAARVGAETHPVRLAALHVLTTMSGSALIALMTAAGDVTAEEAWSAAMVDEDWNADLWGRDIEAEARHTRRKEEFLSAAALLRALL
jgi:chaperone required for assembly of F1-ATPase